jgi:hypothetical protein
LPLCPCWNIYCTELVHWVFWRPHVSNNAKI